MDEFLNEGKRQLGLITAPPLKRIAAPPAPRRPMRKQDYIVEEAEEDNIGESEQESEQEYDLIEFPDDNPASPQSSIVSVPNYVYDAPQSPIVPVPNYVYDDQIAQVIRHQVFSTIQNMFPNMTTEMIAQYEKDKMSKLRAKKKSVSSVEDGVNRLAIGSKKRIQKKTTVDENDPEEKLNAALALIEN